MVELYELDEDGEPIDGAPIEYIAGDPFDLGVRIDGEDRTQRTFTAQIRRSAKDTAKVAEFQVTKSLTEGDTLIVLHLDGDSAIGALDGPTRGLPRTCRADIQEWDSTGARPTIAGFNMVRVEDVSR